MWVTTARSNCAAKVRPASAKMLSDGLLGTQIVRLHAENDGVYGLRKMHALLSGRGWAVGLDQTARIMRSVGFDLAATLKADVLPVQALDMAAWGAIGNLAESVDGLCKTEPICQRSPWCTVEQVELATLEYLWWWNNQCLHSELDYRFPAEVET